MPYLRLSIASAIAFGALCLAPKVRAQAGPNELVGTYDAPDANSAHAFARIELTAEAAPAPQGSPARRAHFRYRAERPDGRTEAGIWWMAGYRSGDGYLMLLADGAHRNVQFALYDIAALSSACALRTRPVRGRRWNTAPEQVYRRRGCGDTAVQVNVQVNVHAAGTATAAQPQAQDSAARSQPQIEAANGMRESDDIAMTDRQVLRAAHLRIRSCFPQNAQTRLTLHARIAEDGSVHSVSADAPRTQQAALRCAEGALQSLRFRRGARSVTTRIIFDPS